MPPPMPAELPLMVVSLDRQPCPRRDAAAVMPAELPLMVLADRHVPPC